MNHPSQGPPGLLNLLDQTGHGDGIRHIDRSVLGDRPQSREFPQLGGSPFGERAATRQNQFDPGDCRQTFGRFVANAGHATHDQVAATGINRQGPRIWRQGHGLNRPPQPTCSPIGQLQPRFRRWFRGNSAGQMGEWVR